MDSFGPLFLVRFLYRNRGENRCFLTFPKQSIVNAENGVFFTLTFSTIPL